MERDIARLSSKLHCLDHDRVSLAQKTYEFCSNSSVVTTPRETGRVAEKSSPSRPTDLVKPKESATTSSDLYPPVSKGNPLRIERGPVARPVGALVLDMKQKRDSPVTWGAGS